LNIIQRGLYFLGRKAGKSEYVLKRTHSISADFGDNEKKIIEFAKPFTLTSPDRILALIDSVRYVIKNNIPGVIVECGVGQGGSIIAAALTLLESKKSDREIYLFDTFEGMTKPTSVDKDFRGRPTIDRFQKNRITDVSSNWIRVEIDEVKNAVFSTKYPKDKFHFVKGPVETTLPDNAPENISILRLDTDWYESTKHELIHLFPKLSEGGVLIIDDYGHHQGCKMAVDEYFKENRTQILLLRVDYTGRVGIKVKS